MWILKIALLVMGITVTALAAPDVQSLDDAAYAQVASTTAAGK
jgi:Tfp pilus assembly protein PilV